MDDEKKLHPCCTTRQVLVLTSGAATVTTASLCLVTTVSNVVTPLIVKLRISKAYRATDSSTLCRENSLPQYTGRGINYFCDIVWKNSLASIERKRFKVLQMWIDKGKNCILLNSWSQIPQETSDLPFICFFFILFYPESFTSLLSFFFGDLTTYHATLKIKRSTISYQK